MGNPGRKIKEGVRQGLTGTESSNEGFRHGAKHLGEFVCTEGQGLNKYSEFGQKDEMKEAEG